LIKGLEDLYNLDKTSIMKLEGFEEKSADNLLEAIENSKTRELSRLIHALGIRHVGQYAAQLLASHFGSIDNLTEARIDELENIKGVGKETAESVVSFFADKENQKLIKTLLERGLSPKAKAKGPLEGKQFVFTGGLESLSRDDASDLVMKHGGIVASSVSKNIDFVVVGDNPGSKYEKAKKMGLKIINEKEFKEMVED
jgi:DNA ligase (NAD+)